MAYINFQPTDNFYTKDGIKLTRVSSVLDYFSDAFQEEEIASKIAKINRSKGTYGNRDGLDNSHKKGGGTVKEKAAKNRRRNGRNGKSKLK